MITKQDLADALWFTGDAFDVRVDVPNLFLGPDHKVGILHGFLPFNRSADKPIIPFQRWKTPLFVVQKDGTTVVQEYHFMLWWNGFPSLSIASSDRVIAEEVKLVLGWDALYAHHHDPLVKRLHLVPLSVSGGDAEITEDNFGDGVEVAMLQTIHFATEAERTDFIELFA